jgi:hypothetical protein
MKWLSNWLMTLPSYLLYLHRHRHAPSRAYTDFGHWLTGLLIITGLALPIVWSHAHIITPAAAIMAVAGGLIVYFTIVGYGALFGGGQGDDY